MAGTFVRDKDVVIASTLISEMALYYKEKGLTLYEALIELYERFGYTQEKLISIELVGKEGQEKISKCIDSLRNNPVKQILEVKIKTSFDYKLSKEIDNNTMEEKEINLPKSNVLKYILEDNSWFVIRLSGTEPKMKIYLAIKAKGLKESNEKIESFEKAVMDIVNKEL